MDEPTFLVQEPTTGQQYHFNIFFSRGDITDNTDVQGFTELGRLHRSTLEIMTDEARIFMPYGKYTILHIDWEVEVVDKINKEDWDKL